MKDGLLHVTFGHSAAHSLRQTLKQLGRDERVAMYPDDLGYGPINPPDVLSRADFYGDEMLFLDNPRRIDEIDAFWADVKRNVSNHVVWFSRRSVREYTGALEYLSRRTTPPLFVDIADVELVDRHGVVAPVASSCFGFVSTETFVRNDLLSRVSRMLPGAFEEARSRWARLKQENALLRVLDASGLVSAPLTYFDEQIIACVTSELVGVGDSTVSSPRTGWRKCAQVIGDASYRCNSGEFDQVREEFLWYRLRYLIEEVGALDSKGDTTSMRDSSVRVWP